MAERAPAAEHGPHAVVVVSGGELRGVLRDLMKPRVDVLTVGCRLDRKYALIDVLGKLPATEAAKRWLANAAAVDAVIRRWP